MVEKKVLRKQILEVRSNIVGRDELSQVICQRGLPLIQRYRKWAAYYPIGGEVDPRHLIELAWDKGVTTAFPVIDGDTLDFAIANAWIEFVPGSFGASTPLITSTSQLLPPQEIDLVLVPGVAFDREGNRLGFGKGYYDRYLANLRPTTLRVALAFSQQLVPFVPSEPHDQQVDFLITEDEAIVTKAGERKGIL